MTTTIYTVAEVGGVEYRSGDGFFEGGSVTLRKGRTGNEATIELADPMLELASSVPLPVRERQRVEEPVFVPGFDLSTTRMVTVGGRTQVRVFIGQGPPASLVFAGVVTGLEAEGLRGRLTLTAGDKARGARRIERSLVRSDVAADALIREFADFEELDVDFSRAPRLSEIRFTQVTLYGETTQDALDRLLGSSGHTWYVDDETIVVEEVGTQHDEPVEVLFGEDVRDGFRFRVEEFRRGTTPNVISADGQPLYDGADAQFFDEDAVERFTRLERTGLALQAAAAPALDSQRIQQAIEAQSRARKVFKASLTLTTVRPDITLDTTLLLRGFGPRFSGIWFVERITHPLASGGTRLELYNGGG